MGSRLWHLAVAVLATALLLSGLVALRKEATASGVGGSLVISGITLTFAITSLTLGQLANSLSRPPLGRLRDRARRRGVVAESWSTLVCSLADPAILIGSIAVGLAAAYGLGWLILPAGRF